MSTTPNMNITLATPGSDEGIWGAEVNTGISTIDAHDHTPGKGVPVPSTAIDFVSDIDMAEHSLSGANKLQMIDQGSALTGTSNKLALNAASGDLYYTNSSGVAVQITQGSSITSPTSSAALPTGAVMPFAGTSAPTGWLLSDGSAVSRTTYASLFGVIGTTYGTGDGSTTFNLPNMSGRVAVGVGTYTDPVSGTITRSLAQASGAEKHQLTTAELASHNHTQNPHNHAITDPGHFHTVTADASIGGSTRILQENQVASGFTANYNTDSKTTGITINNATATNQATGGDTSHNNMQPYLGLNYIIKT
jgi:microcystin-dependent protein